MSANRGKEFENLFKKFCEDTHVNCIRFYDVMQGFKSVNNPCDFVISKDKFSFSLLVECKSTNSTSFSLKFRQHDLLVNLDNFNSVVLIWFIERKEIWSLSIQNILQMEKDGINSFNPVKHQKYGQRITTTFARVKPVFMDVFELW